jgi:hypothetical protein
MARKSRRGRHSHSRKMKHTRKHRVHRRRTYHRRTHRRGGAGAPLSYHLSGSWPSRMSLGQGADYFKYHEGQHGGAALAYGSFPGAVVDTGLPQALRGPAHIGGIDKAIADVKGLCDPPNCPGTEGPVVKGGNRRAGRKSRKGGNRRNKNNTAVTNAVIANSAANTAIANAVVANSAAVNATEAANVANMAVVHNNAAKKGGRNRRRGGALGYAPFPSQGMLLNSQKQYAEAGLNPEWKTDVAFTDAKIRNSQ